LLYNYWGTKKTLCNYPLYRPNWPTHKRGPFLPREPTNYTELGLRRFSKKLCNRVTTQLRKEFKGIQDISSKLLLREQIKLKEVNLEIQSFLDQAASLSSASKECLGAS
jgi:hypothetical protein